MELHSLCVLHRSKMNSHSQVTLTHAWADSAVFQLETCQRWIWVLNSDRLIRSVQDFKKEGLDVYQGVEAYSFLLRVACGLESEIIGETDIFGQLKAAWKKIENFDSAWVKELSCWFQRLFEDTKYIRTRYIQNMGGSSYGSLVRKLIQSFSGKYSDGPVLFVGAGQIARSVAPYLSDTPLWLVNRDQRHLDDFYAELTQNPRSRVTKICTLAEEKAAWAHAAVVVLCIPAMPESDPDRVDSFRLGEAQRPVIHLGVNRDASGIWKDLPSFYALDDLFRFQNALGNLRSFQAAQAEKACFERATLRSLGNSVSIPHGWEDLLCFV